MESYRFYLLSHQNKIVASANLDARDDADVLAKAPSFSISAEFPAIKIWRGTRKVGRIDQTVT